MTEDEKKKLQERIAAWLAERPDSTVADIAAGLGADEWDVQHQLLFMVNRDAAQQVGKRRLLGEQRPRPIYRMNESR